MVLDPVSILLPVWAVWCSFYYRCRSYWFDWFVTVVPVMIPAVRYCRCKVLTWFQLNLSIRLTASVLELLPGLWYYLFSFNSYRFSSQYSSRRCCRLHCFVDRYFSWHLWHLWQFNPRSRCDLVVSWWWGFAMLFYRLKDYYLFFFQPIQPPFFFVLVTLASYSYSSRSWCSCSYRYCSHFYYENALVAFWMTQEGSRFA